MNTEDLTRETFAPHVSDTFRVATEKHGTIDLVLLEAETMPGERAEGERKPFSLLFRGPDDQVYGQGIWPLEHEKLGRLEVFVVPLGPSNRGLLYEVVFG